MITFISTRDLAPYFDAAAARARTAAAGHDRWLAAIERAVETFHSLDALSYLESGELLVPGSQPGVVYAATPAACQCKASRHGVPCRHRALARLVEIALGLRLEAQRVAQMPVVVAPAPVKTAQEEIDELFA